MKKLCAICNQPFETLSEKRQTCSVECAEKYSIRRKQVASYANIESYCTQAFLDRQYHGSILD